MLFDIIAIVMHDFVRIFAYTKIIAEYFALYNPHLSVNGG